MKTYKKVKLEAKNASSGSYVAGCPPETHQGGNPSYEWLCRRCEVRV